MRLWIIVICPDTGTVLFWHSSSTWWFAKRSTSHMRRCPENLRHGHGWWIKIHDPPMEDLAFRWPSGSPNVQFRVFDPNLQDPKPTFWTLTRRLGTGFFFSFFPRGVIFQDFCCEFAVPRRRLGWEMWLPLGQVGIWGYRLAALAPGWKWKARARSTFIFLRQRRMF